MSGTFHRGGRDFGTGFDMMDRIERLEAALKTIRELNMTAPDEIGHQWANSDLIEQEIVAAIARGM